MENSFLPALSQLSTGKHVCLIYDSEENYRLVVEAYIRQGIQNNEKIFCLLEEHTPETILGYLADLNTDFLQKNKQLTLIKSVDSQWNRKGYANNRMLDSLKQGIETAITEGYTGIRLVGEMSWAVQEDEKFEHLMAYECHLNEAFPGNPYSAMCVYDRRKFNPDLLQDCLMTHPTVISGTEAYNNFYYIPPAELSSEDLPEARLNQWLKNLERAKLTEEKLNITRFWVESVSDSVFWIGPDARILYANEAACQSLGYSLDELVDMRVPDIDPDFTDEIWPDHWRNLKESKGFSLESVHRTKDGRLIPVEISVNYLEYDGKEYNCAIARDLTDRKKTEQALHDSEVRFRVFVEAVKDYAIFMLDPKGMVINWNAGAERVHGYTHDEIIGHHYSCFYPQEEIKRGKPGYVLSTAARRGAFEQEGWWVRKDGSKIWAQVVMSPLNDQEGKIYGFAVVLRDITQRKLTDEAQKMFKLSLLNDV